MNEEKEVTLEITGIIANVLKTEAGYHLKDTKRCG